ncbi:MAG: hypothetical protein ACLFNN_00020 [Candidatus Paceibacterota bacterium]
MSEKPPVNNPNEEKQDPQIHAETAYRGRDDDTQEYMEEVRKEMEEDVEKREKNKKDQEELDNLKKEWFAQGKGKFLPEEKQKRLNELEDAVYNYKEMRKKKKKTEGKESDEKTEKEKGSEEVVQETPGESQEEERSSEEILKEKRKEFAKMDLDQVNKESPSQEYVQKKQEYIEALKNRRKERIESLDPSLSKEDRDKEIERIMTETLTLEANNLHEAKLEAALNEKPDSLKEKAKETGKKVANWYRGLPLRYKLGISAGLLGLGAGAGALGGAAGAALATGAIAGSRAQRVLSGAATAVGLEGLIKKSQEKKTEKEVSELFAKGLEEKLNSGNAELDNKLFELEGRKKGERYRRYILAGTAGVLVGSGAVSKAIDGISSLFDPGEVPTESHPENKNDSIPGSSDAYEGNVLATAGSEPESTEFSPIEETEEDEPINHQDIPRPQDTSQAGVSGEGVVNESQFEEHRFDVQEFDEQPEWIKNPEMATAGSSGIEFGVEIKPGESVWSTTESFLKDNLGDKFEDLNEAQKTHLIDQIKDKIAEDPSNFGMEGVDSIDMVQAGQKIDFSPLAKDGLIGSMLESSNDLSQEAMESIVRNNEIIEEWVKENPGERLTSEKVDNILYEKGIAEEQMVKESSAETKFSPIEEAEEETDPLKHQDIPESGETSEPDPSEQSGVEKDPVDEEFVRKEGSGFEFEEFGFEYDTEGNVSDMHYKGNLKHFDPNKFIDLEAVNEDPARYLEKEGEIQSSLGDIKVHEQVLREMEDKDKLGSKEYDWVKNRLQEKIALLKEDHGNIFEEEKLNELAK